MKLQKGKLYKLVDPPSFQQKAGQSYWKHIEEYKTFRNNRFLFFEERQFFDLAEQVKKLWGRNFSYEILARQIQYSELPRKDLNNINGESVLLMYVGQEKEVLPNEWFVHKQDSNRAAGVYKFLGSNSKIIFAIKKTTRTSFVAYFKEI